MPAINGLEKYILVNNVLLYADHAATSKCEAAT